jgi:adenylate cyclase
MMLRTSRLYRAAILGIITGVAGLLFIFTPFGLKLEEQIGLDILFKVRGVRHVPPDVIIVGIDKYSSEKLNLPNNPERWSRSLYTRLTERVIRDSPAVIAFDIFFKDPRSPDDDKVFAEAIAKARNVVIVESIEREKMDLHNGSGTAASNVNIEKLVPPLPVFAESSAAVSPFPLPKVPVKVSQYWTCKPTAGNTASLPIIAFQIYALRSYEEFITLAGRVRPSILQGLPRDMDEIIHEKKVETLIRDMREVFKGEPMIGETMLDELRQRGEFYADSGKKDILKSVIKMYQSPESRYLNFYGPPRTITTIPAYDVLQNNSAHLNFRGKAVFIGSSDLYQPEQRDGFYTVFSDSNGLDISGVEIAATAFANLLEDMPVKQLRLIERFLVVFMFGMAVGIFCRPFPALFSAAGVLIIGAAYSAAVLYQFSGSGIWYPLVTPLFFQIPMALLAGLACKYRDSNRERQKIKTAFKYYLPDDIVERLSKDITGIETSAQIVYGTCLYTDAESYTSVSEKMDPKEISGFLNRYYESVFEPVKQHGGIVSNVIGDSMLAIWVTLNPNADSKRQASLAALDINRAIHSQARGDVKLPTRMGLHFGKIMLGNIGAIDHYEYRPVGDIVNTASRIEGMNKYLGTRILLSGEIMDNLNGFLTREIGTFLLAGKSQPVTVHELICREEESSSRQKGLSSAFAAALKAFKSRSWQEASEKFRALINDYDKDGPSVFYLEFCKKYIANPPEEGWSGIISIEKK